jgi:predicted transcriptional regulator
MRKAVMRAATRKEILDAISDAKSLRLLSSIGRGQGSPSKDLIVQLGISRREYYLRMSKLVKIDLVTRRNGEWHLSKFGMVIYGVLLLLIKEINVTRHKTKVLTV